MKFDRHTLRLIFTVFVVIIVLLMAQRYLGDALSETITILTAVIGGFAILYQLRKDYQISKAEFIYSLNDTFSNNAEIAYVYTRLKLFRDQEITELTKDEGRRMGDYVMFFEIMGYLLDEGMITLDMMDRIFANKFFIFMNNPYTQIYQLKYSRINRPILELYCKWFNYRKKNDDTELYPTYSLLKFDDYILKKTNGEVYLNQDKMNIGYDS